MAVIFSVGASNDEARTSILLMSVGMILNFLNISIRYVGVPDENQ